MPLPYKVPGPQLAGFLKSDHRLRALIGPVYGGRKSAAAFDIVRRAIDPRYRPQRVWRWVVVRQRRDELEAETVACVQHWLAGEGEYDAKARQLLFAFELDDGLERLIEYQFLAMDEAVDRRRLPSLECSAVWLDDARNFAEGVLDDARLICGRYPGGLDGGCQWRGIIATSRMPLPGHWLITRDDIELYRQPSGRSPQAENIENLKAKGFSYSKLAAAEDPDWVARYVDAEITGGAKETAAEASREAARGSLTQFIQVAMPDIEPAAHHQLIISKLEAVARGESKRLMLFLPPGSAKSTYASVLFPPWFMGNHPSLPVIAASHSKELAERFGRRVRNIVGSSLFRDTFGFGLSGDSGAAGRWETARGGEYFAVGVDASVTGRRCALGIIDDPVKGRADADSATVRQHVWDWYKSDFWTRLIPGAAIILIMTRWHDDDLAGRLLEEAKNGGEQWDIVNLPMLAEADDPLGRAPGEKLWPEWFTDEMIATARRDPRNWSALYMQRPMPESGDYFKTEWFRWYDKMPPREQLRTYGASDYATKQAGGDYTVHLVVGLDPNADIYLLDLYRAQVSPDQWIDPLLDLMARWKTITWAEEAGQIKNSVGPFITKRQLERKIYAVRRQFTSSSDKAARAQAIRGRAGMGKVYLPRGAPWVVEFLHELLRFPAGIHDDQVDGFSLIGRMLDEMVPGNQPVVVPRPLADPVNLDPYGPGGSRSTASAPDRMRRACGVPHRAAPTIRTSEAIDGYDLGRAQGRSSAGDCR
jgi:predicted phage terminase large subunit-like protein